MRIVAANRLAWRRRLLAVLAASVVVLVSGCLRVVRQQAPYYRKGPHQVEPPDGFLDPGTHVLVFGQKESYSHVLTLDGIAADVWNGDLATPGEWRKEQKARKVAEPRGSSPGTRP